MTLQIMCLPSNCVFNVQNGTIKEELHVKKLYLELNVAFLVGKVDQLTVLLHVFKDFMYEAEILRLLLVLFEHVLPVHKSKETWNKLLEDLKSHLGFESSRRLAETS